MRYGFEQSFTHQTLRRVFSRAGFHEIQVGFYDYGQTLCRRIPILGSVFHRLIRCTLWGWRPFDDIAYVRATKRADAEDCC